MDSDRTSFTAFDESLPPLLCDAGCSITSSNHCFMIASFRERLGSNVQGMQNSQSMDYKYSFTASSYSALGNTRILTNSQKYLCTFQLFIGATKITNVWSQQQNLRVMNTSEWLQTLQFRFFGGVFCHIQSASLQCVYQFRKKGCHSLNVRSQPKDLG